MQYEYWFARIKELTNKKKKVLRGKVACAKELYYIEETALASHGITTEEYAVLVQGRRRYEVEAPYQEMVKKGVRAVYLWQEEYPNRLRNISSAPYVLYVKGELPREDVMTVAIVGARECSPYGEVMARTFAEGFARAGAQIISGMARGVDASGQKGAIAVGGRSFAVLGCGVDVCYPREHIELYMELTEHGGILSEQPLGEKPLPQYFPARNRLISGLADVVLVMEAKERSGSLITADMALEQGKDVYALPGPVNSALSRGCNNLIRQGAGILLSVEEVLEELGLSNREIVKNLRKSTENKISLETKENILYSCLSFSPMSVGELSEQTGMSIAEVFDGLMELEMRELVRELSKNYYVKSK